MSAIEEKIILEAAKPASAVIGALLAPKIEKIKLWANERELKGQLDPENLSKVMEEYLIKLSLRVSEITSIAFPLIKMDIFKAYEPLSLERLHFNQLECSNDVGVANFIDENIKSCLIIDNAGMGKSTFSKFVVASLLFKSKRIPILFELRKIDRNSSLIDNLAKELDFPGKVFDRSLFYKLLQLGKFYVIIDGFDEVSLDYHHALSNQINELSIKGGNNIIFMTSRPQDVIPDIVKSETLQFKPFSLEQAVSLLKRYDDISGLSVGRELTFQIENVPEKFIESPLLVSLLYRTFGVNKSIAEKTCTFYEEIYHALYKGHDLINKNGYGREKKSTLDFEDFRKLLRAMCYFMMLNRKTSFEGWSEAIKYIDKAASICSIIPSSASNFLDDLLVSVPLMHKDGNEIKFFHKTLLEYFSAEYLLFNKSSLTLLGKLFHSKQSSSFDKTFEFLFELNSSLYDSVITHYFATLAEGIGYGDSIFETALYTLIFRRHCKLGLWRCSKYSHKMVGSLARVFTGGNQSGLSGAGYHTCTWNQGVLNGEEYFVALSYTDVKSNLHPCAWKSISETVEVEEDSHEKISTEDMKILHDTLGVDIWNDLDVEMIGKIKGANSLLDLILSSISSDRFGNSGEARLLSRKSVNIIIDKVVREEQFATETDQFLL